MLSPEVLREAIDRIESQLEDIRKTVNKIDVQNERLVNLEKSVDTYWRKYDSSVVIMDEVRRHQASCPREQLRWVWWVLVPQSMVLLGLLFGVLHTLSK